METKRKVHGYECAYVFYSFILTYLTSLVRFGGQDHVLTALIRAAYLFGGCLVNRLEGLGEEVRMRIWCSPISQQVFAVANM